MTIQKELRRQTVITTALLVNDMREYIRVYIAALCHSRLYV